MRDFQVNGLKKNKPCQHDGFVYRTTNTTIKDNDGVYCKPCGEQLR